MVRSRVLPLLLIAAAGLAPGIATAQAPVTAAPVDDLSPPVRHHATFFARRLTGYLPARDGTQLRYSVLLPKGKGPFPVIVNYSGYDPGSIGGAAYMDDNTAMSVDLDRTLVAAGYAVVGINARGTACSEGQFEFLARSYGEDGYDAIEWLARQPWSNGAIGMANWSWAGMSQLATASERPPHLKAIAPGMPLGDARLDSWFPGGVPAPGFVDGWWNFLHARWDAAAASARAEGDQRCLAQVARNYQTAETNRLPTILIRHPLRDDYIEIRNLAARTGRINVPVLSMEAFQDEAVISRMGYFQETLDPSRLWYVQTNGAHDLYVAMRFRKDLVAFFDHFVKGDANGFENTPHVQVWIEGTYRGPAEAMYENLAPGITFAHATYPLPATPLALALSAGGQLVAGTAGTGAADGFDYPMRGPGVNYQFGRDGWEPLARDWRRGTLAYTSAPFDHNVVAYGPASADLWLTTGTADADVQVTVTEVRPDGQEMFVQRGWLRLSDRAQDAGRSTMTRPWPIDRPETMLAMVPGEPALARIEVQKFAHAFRKGSRLRLWIDTPSQYGGSLFAPQSVPTRITVLHDAMHPSRLVIGTVAGVAVPAALAVCGTVIHQPCRPDPLEHDAKKWEPVFRLNHAKTKTPRV
jgi:putative CocE/NonD family hydrolase